MGKMRLATKFWMWPLFAGALAWKHVSDDALLAALRENDYTFVAFVHPDSDISKELEAEWTAVQNSQKDANVVSIDCGAHSKTCLELDVTSYPAIRVYHKDGRVDRYRGERKQKQAQSFLKRALRGPHTVADPRTVSSYAKADDIVFIAHFSPKDSSLRERFTALAKKYWDQYMFILTDPIQPHPVLQCINYIDEDEHTTAELGAFNSLEEFVKKCAAPLIPVLTRKNEAEYSSTGKSLLHFFFASPAGRDKLRSELRPLAKKYAEFLHFALTDVNEYPEMLQLLGLKKGSKTGMSLQNPNTGDVFPYVGKKGITPDVVERFLNDVIEGKVQPISQKLGQGHDEL